MERSVEVLVGMAAMGLMAVEAVVAYTWRQKKRIRGVEKRVKEFLRVRYGELPDSLSIHCSHDPHWPVLVAFDAPRTGIRHTLQFTCGEKVSTFAVVSDREESRS